MDDARPGPGTLFIVGLGPGSPGLLPPDATRALEASEVIVGYQGYLDQVAGRIAGKEIVGRELGQEVERAGLALDSAEAGKVVALVSSGDAGIYGMGGVAFELAASRRSRVEIVVVPGITAACSAAARLGAPLAHDWASISLSDLLTPREVIVDRVLAAARADFVLVLYNPASRTRAELLPEVAARLLEFRPPETPVGLVENAFRDRERVEVVRLDDLANRRAAVNMFTTVVIGSSRTRLDRGRMVTPRIYAAKAASAAEPPASAPGAIESRADPGPRIMAESLAIIDRELGPEPRDASERAVVRRVVHASADFEFADLLRFGPGAIEATLRGLRGGDGSGARPAAILADVEMLRAGIRADLLGPVGVGSVCCLNDPETIALAAAEGITRSAAGIRRGAARVGDRAVVAIGNAPTALEEALRLVHSGGWRPIAIIGIPVGFVGVEASKRRLIEGSRGVPYITAVGRKGGTAVTAAVVNALLELAGTRRGRSD